LDPARLSIRYGSVSERVQRELQELKHHKNNQADDARSKRHRSDRTINGITHVGVAVWFGRNGGCRNVQRALPGQNVPAGI